MQEYSFDIVQALRNGLVRDTVRPVNELGLINCRNLRSDEDGLREFKTITAPLSTTANNDWPFPQFFVGEDRKILAGATGLFYVTDNGTTSAITIRDATSPASTTSILTGGQWHHASFDRAWFLTNSTTLVWQIPSTTTGVAEWTVSTNHKVNTVCSFGGRLVMGGVSTTPAFFSGTAWSEIWSAWEANSPQYEFLRENIEFDTNWVFWSEEVGGDLQWPFALQVAALGYPTSARTEALMEFILDEIRSGGIGFARLPYRGEVLRCLPLGPNLIVYGERGIGVLDPTLRMNKLRRVGLPSRSCVGGDEEDHLFIDRTGYLWELNLNLTLTRHDFKHLLSTLSYGQVVIVRDAERKEWYISDGTTGYLFNGTSLSETTIFPTTLEIDGTDLIGVTKDLSDSNFNIRTTWLDMKFPGLKTIHGVQVTGQDLKMNSTLVRVEYRYKGFDSYSTHGPVALNSEGVAHMYLTALQFRVRVSGPLGTDTRIDYIRIKYQRPDRRASRGIFRASENDARTSGEGVEPLLGLP